MSDSSRIWVTLAAVVVAVFVVLKVVAIVGWLINLLMPLLVVAAIGYVVFVIVDRKSLGGGRRPLP